MNGPLGPVEVEKIYFKFLNMVVDNFTITLKECPNDIIIMFEFEPFIAGIGSATVASRCPLNATSYEFCDATVNCTFSYDELTNRVKDRCEQDYKDGYDLWIGYFCLPGKLSYVYIFNPNCEMHTISTRAFV